MTPFDELIFANVAPIDELSRRYRITINNRSSDTLLEGEFDQKWLLHPGQFSGLDDTHMPWDIWTPSPLLFDVLPARSEITFEIDGYDVPCEYDGNASKGAKMNFRRLQSNRREPGDREERIVKVYLDWAKSRLRFKRP